MSFNLSEKRKFNCEVDDAFYKATDVREFIKRLKQLLEYHGVDEEIDKLAGKDLV